MRAALRYCNIFILMGVGLCALAIAGFASGNIALKQPGEPLQPAAAAWYLAVGALMLVNGVVSIRNSAPAEQVARGKHAKDGANLEGNVSTGKD